MQQVGEVVAVKGTATAVSGEETRELQVGSPVYEQDVLSTSDSSNLEIHFADDTVFSQGPNSEFAVDDYVFDAEDPEASEMFFNMAAGTFRMVTGKIAAGNPDAVSVKSPLAVIGIRGTTTVHRINVDGTEQHGAEDLTGDHVLVMTDSFGNTQLITFDAGAVDFEPGQPMQPVRQFSPQEIEQFRNIVPFTSLGEPSPDADEEQGGENQETQSGEPQGGENEQAGGEEQDGNDRADGEETAEGEVPEEEIPEEPAPAEAMQEAPEPAERELIGQQSDEMLWGGSEVLENPTQSVQAAPDSNWSGSGETAVGGEQEQDPNEGLSAEAEDSGNDDPPVDAAEETEDQQQSSSELPGIFYDHLDNFIFGTAEGETLEGGSGEDGIFGRAGDDLLIGGYNDDYLEGGPGNDYLQGYFQGQSEPTDTWGAASEWDAAGYYFAGGSVIVNLETGLATGAAGDDTLVNIGEVVGSDYCDTIIGSTGRENEFMPRGGDDYLNGNSQDNGVSFESATQGVLVDLDVGYAQGEGNDTLVNITNAFGSDYNDTILGSSDPDAYHRYEGLKGDDYIEARGSGANRIEYVHADGSVTVDLQAERAYGADGNDTIIGFNRVKGSYHDDSIFGDSGDEKLRGLGGDDWIDGRVGDGDWVEYNSSPDAVKVDLGYAAGYGRAWGAEGNDTLVNIERVRGSEYNDTIYGDGNNNVIAGRTGDDIMNAGGGDQDIADYSGTVDQSVYVDLSTGRSSGYFGNDTLIGFEGIVAPMANDTLVGDGGDNFLFGGYGNDSIVGGAGSDIFEGNAGDDTIEGGSGMDYMYGSEGNDYIYGGEGDDVFQYDAGADTYYYHSLSDVTGGDSYYEFIHAQDTFLFNSSIFDSGAGFESITSGYTGSETSSNSAVFVYDQSLNTLYYDADGNTSAATQEIAFFLDNQPDNMDAGDIEFTGGV